MWKRQSSWTDELEFLGEVWSAFAIGFEEQTTSSLQTTQPSSYPTSQAALSMPPTIVVTVPQLTFTETIAIVVTTFVTVPASVIRETSSSSLQSTSMSAMTDSLTSTSTHLAMSPISTRTPKIGSTSETTASPSAMPTPHSNQTSSSMAGGQSDNQVQKHAIVGGLSGSIAGLLFIGVLVCLALRYQQKRRRSGQLKEAFNEKGIGPVYTPPWATVDSRDSPSQLHQTTWVVSPTDVDEEHRMIRMNTRHWLRPYAPGSGEGLRDSVPSGILRVTNPDLSRPVTPQQLYQMPRKQRSSLSGFMFNKAKPPAAAQQTRKIPSITVIEPTLSRECILPKRSSRTPSYRSYPSVGSASIIHQQPPEDPFAARPSYPEQYQGQYQHQYQPQHRPGLATPQTTAAASAAPRTWTQILNPFSRSRPNLGHAVSTDPTTPPANARLLSHFSVSTAASRMSRRSDPFDLSIRGSRPPRGVGWILYEGT